MLPAGGARTAADWLGGIRRRVASRVRTVLLPDNFPRGFTSLRAASGAVTADL